ncbi:MULTISPECIES: putative porin [unclassified Candidatus Cardinium]|uniref:putative porin n=1 Tax=unclassified Candidatus Cardinium TaxID=2641185 RepID=UPI001FB23DF7|nr:MULTISPECIES: putative porin [unclassified Candidatus Cardinium]
MVDLSIYWRYSLFFLFFALPISGYGSEKAEDIFEKPEEEKVGAGSTFFITPREVKQNYRKYHRMDRSVTKMDHFTVAERHTYNFQDLGNHFTAAQHIVYELPQHIGATYGLAAYDFYFHQPQDIRYYYTSKAYADFNIVLANLGSFLFNGCYTQRLLPNWHIGTNWYGAMAENEWPYSKDDKIVNAFPNFDLFTHIKNADGCYHLFTSWSNRKYITRETGGVRSTKTTTNKIKDEFAFTEPNPSKRYHSSFPLLEEPYMQNKIDKDKKVMHKDLRRNFYFYHHYEYSQPLQVYHELHYSQIKNFFTIEKLDQPLLSFISNQPDNASDKEDNRLLMRSLGHEIGIKGDIDQPNLFYAVYYRLEDIDLNYDFSKPEELVYNRPLKKAKKEKEHYLGGNTRLQFGQHSQLCLDGAYLLQKGGYHKLNLAYKNHFFKIACHTIKHKTPYIVSHGYSRHRLWDKHFVPPSAQAIDAAIWYNWTHITVHPILSFKKINNHIYYRKARPYNQHNPDHCVAEPVQATAPIYLLSLESNLNFCFFYYFHFDNTFTILKDLSRNLKVFKGYMPPYIYTGRYYYAHQPYHKKMAIETGLNIHFKELYYGDGYDMIAQQFYRQNQFPVQGRPIVDIFCNLCINNLKLSFKYSYINEYFHKPEAYFATPFYPGLKKAADIGIHWSFFD